MPDLLLVFPPQWSPFQPALSLPSLSAWLKRAGFEVASLDLNLDFYEWLLSDDCAESIIGAVDRHRWPQEVKLAYRAIFANVQDFRDDIRRLKGAHPCENGSQAEEYFRPYYLAVKSLETYLHAVSKVCQEFTVSPYGFKLACDGLNTTELERLVFAPPPLLDEYLSQAVTRHIVPKSPRSIGISCIGQEQLYLTLLLGAKLKETLQVPILVGGTILSRIFERGVLERGWFDRFFDVIVRNEGEKPVERLLENVNSGRPLVENVPGIVYSSGGGIVSSPSCPPLQPKEIPPPDFEDLPLGQYLSPEVTLPLLSSRGCYWGRCEFCHHGMVYGEQYAGYDIHDVFESVKILSHKYGVRHFAFNDEAIPPRLLRAMGETFPPHEATHWTFTGLIKFEKYFQEDDWERAHRIGFRSLYVGLESASERVLGLMKKNSRRQVVVKNLTEATSSGIWIHCFLFFGFPGETEEDARESYDFVLSTNRNVSFWTEDDLESYAATMYSKFRSPKNPLTISGRSLSRCSAASAS